MPENYCYIGRYKTPCLYSGLVCSWHNSEKLSSLGIGSLSSDTMHLDGHLFINKNTWNQIIKKTKDEITKENSLFFKRYFILCENQLDNIFCSSEKLLARPSVNYIKKFLSSVNSIQFPWVIALPMAEAFDTEIPDTKTRLIRQKKHAYKIKSRLSKIKNPDNIKQIRIKDRKLAIDIVDHVIEYRWIGHMHFWGEEFSSEKLLQQINYIKDNTQKMPQKDSIIYKRTSLISYYRNSFAEACAFASYCWIKSFDVVSELLDIENDLINWLSPEEFYSALKGAEIPEKNVLIERRKGYGILNNEKGSSILVGGKLKTLLKKHLPETKEEGIKGTIAHHGKTSGKVKIIFEPSDIKKMQKGDVLVASETTPDFVLGLNLASAIVIDQGGITSHAAIISREYNIPCIVGTKIATKVLKDGDLVEVDADKGVVRRL